MTFANTEGFNTERFKVLRLAQHHMQAGQWEQAQKVLAAGLHQSPNDPHMALMLIEALFQLNRHDRAVALAEQALANHPANPDMHRAMARLHLAKDGRNSKDLATAKQHAEQAIQLAPQDADMLLIMAVVERAQKRWQAALDWTDKALAQDPEHEDALALRSDLLNQLGRKKEARAQAFQALAQAPNSADAHASHGWVCLQQNDPKAALAAFKEALRLEPNNALARQGLVEALKAKNPIYRLMLAFFMWMGRLQPRVRMGLVIGACLLMKALGNLSEQQPELAPAIAVVSGIYLAFVGLTWVAVPLFNLLLRLSPTGRHALTDDQRHGSTLFGLGLAAVLGILGVAVFAEPLGLSEVWQEALWNHALLAAACLLPFSHACQKFGTKAFALPFGLSSGLFLVTLLALVAAGLQSGLAAPLFMVALFGLLAMVWGTALLESNR